MTLRIGIIGLGEAGGAIASGLNETGRTKVTGYDVRLSDREIRARWESSGINLASSLAELAESSEVLVCLTHASTAIEVARGVSPHLGEHHLYSDWNSGGPRLKKELDSIVSASGARFVDGAVMAAVPRQRHEVPVLLSGSGAEDFKNVTVGLGMNVEVLGSDPGQASAVKMLRSLLVKGLEALIIECLVAARKYGAEEKVLSSMNGSLPTEDWAELASYLTSRSYLHSRRRAEEMGQVAATLRDAGVEPLVALGCEERLLWLADLELTRSEAPQPAGYAEVMTRIEEAAR